MLRGDRVGHLLQHRGLARLGGRDDQTALALPDGGNQVDDPGEDVVGLALDLEPEPGVGEQRGEVGEAGPVSGLLGIEPVDLEDADGGGELLLCPGGADGPATDVTLAQPRLAHQVGRHVDVLVAWEVSGTAQEPVTLGKDVEDALADLELALVDRLLVGAVATSVAAAPGTTLPVAESVAVAARTVGEPAVRELAVGALTGAVAALLAGAGRIGRVGDLGDVGDHRSFELVGLEDRRDQLGLLQPVVIDFDLARHATQVVEPQLLQLGPCGHFG